MVLIGENMEEGILEVVELIIAFAWHGDCLAFSRRGILLDEMLDVVVVNVVCDCVSRGQSAIPRD